MGTIAQPDNVVGTLESCMPFDGSQEEDHLWQVLKTLAKVVFVFAGESIQRAIRTGQQHQSISVVGQFEMRYAKLPSIGGMRRLPALLLFAATSALADNDYADC